MNSPPLVTTGPPQSAGILGLPDTRVLYGNELESDVQSGGRFTAGHWFDCCGKRGFEVSYFFLASRADRFTAGSLGDPILARPIFNVSTGREDIEQIANPPIPNPLDPNSTLLPITGGIVVANRSRMWGAEANGLANLSRANCRSVDFLLGFRYIELDESINIAEDLLVPLNSPLFPGTRFAIFDGFGTRNNFYGGQLGLRCRSESGRFFADAYGKLALGSTHQTVFINGDTRTTDAQGNTTTRQGGLLALSSNIGQYERDIFAVIPEFGVALGYRISERVRGSVGYNFLYWSNVARPGEHIDRTVNPTLLPGAPVAPSGPARPAFAFNGTDFYVHGLTFGLEFNW